eukprot:scaffold874_cov95-Isochrysis_galbana.AAC.3
MQHETDRPNKRRQAGMYGERGTAETERKYHNSRARNGLGNMNSGEDIKKERRPQARARRAAERPSVATTKTDRRSKMAIRRLSGTKSRAARPTILCRLSAFTSICLFLLRGEFDLGSVSRPSVPYSIARDPRLASGVRFRAHFSRVSCFTFLFLLGHLDVSEGLARFSLLPHLSHKCAPIRTKCRFCFLTFMLTTNKRHALSFHMSCSRVRVRPASGVCCIPASRVGLSLVIGDYLGLSRA